MDAPHPPLQTRWPHTLRRPSTTAVQDVDDLAQRRDSSALQRSLRTVGVRSLDQKAPSSQARRLSPNSTARVIESHRPTVSVHRRPQDSTPASPPASRQQSSQPPFEQVSILQRQGGHHSGSSHYSTVPRPDPRPPSHPRRAPTASTPITALGASPESVQSQADQRPPLIDSPRSPEHPNARIPRQQSRYGPLAPVNAPHAALRWPSSPLQCSGEHDCLHPDRERPPMHRPRRPPSGTAVPAQNVRSGHAH